VSAENDLAALKTKAQNAERRYLQAVADLNAKSDQLKEELAELAGLGCATLKEAEVQVESLESLLATQISELEELLV
jgi:hypothetical protein